MGNVTTIALTKEVASVLKELAAAKGKKVAPLIAELAWAEIDRLGLKVSERPCTATYVPPLETDEGEDEGRVIVELFGGSFFGASMSPRLAVALGAALVTADPDRPFDPKGVDLGIVRRGHVVTLRTRGLERSMSTATAAEIGHAILKVVPLERWPEPMRMRIEHARTAKLLAGMGIKATPLFPPAAEI